MAQHMSLIYSDKIEQLQESGRSSWLTLLDKLCRSVKWKDTFKIDQLKIADRYQKFSLTDQRLGFNISQLSRCRENWYLFAATFGLLLVFLFPGDGEYPDSNGSELNLMSATPTFERPEIGKIMLDDKFICTGILSESPTIVLTAGHCIFSAAESDRRKTEKCARTKGFYTGDEVKGRYVFEIEHSPTISFRYSVEFAWSFGLSLHDHDIGILRLAEPVPANVAVPATLAQTFLDERKARFDWFGYGCSERVQNHKEGCGSTNGWIGKGSGIKRARKDTSMIYSTQGCFGDSGGPVANKDGEIYAISSQITWHGYNGFSAIPRHYNTIMTIVSGYWGPLIEPPKK